RFRRGGDVQRDRGERDGESGDAGDDGRERGGDGDLLDPGHGGPNGYGPGDGERARGESGDLHGDRHSGDGGDDRGEQSHEPAGDGWGRRELATLGDREGRERESRFRGGGDVQRDRGQRDRESGDARDDGRERGGDGDLLDPRHGRPNGYGPGDGERACGEPGDLHGDGHGGDGGDDCREQSHEPAGDGGGRRCFTAVGAREGCERESRFRGGGDVQRDRGERDRGSGDARDDGRERGGDGDLLDPRDHGPNGHRARDGE